MRVSFFPNTPRWSENPYYPLLRSALERRGVTFALPESDYLSTAWLWRQRTHVNVLHFHWMQYHYSTPPYGSWLALAKFLTKVFLARLLGYRIVWTMHNVLPHEKAPQGMDFLARLGMAHLAHAVLVLCEEGRSQLMDMFKRSRNVFVTPIGPYQGASVNDGKRRETRAELGLGHSEVVFLNFGNIRKYKNVQALLAAFLEVAHSDWRLIIAGRPSDNTIAENLSRAADQDSRVLLRLRFVPREELEFLMFAADVAIFSFRDVLSSSSVVEAMSFGLPVIAPARGCLPEWVPPSCGILYDPTRSAGLQEAMRQAAKSNLHRRGETARQHALSFDWNSISTTTINTYLGK